MANYFTRVVQCTRSKHDGENVPRVHITGFGQRMPQGDSLKELLPYSENKNDTICLLVEYLITVGICEISPENPC